MHLDDKESVNKGEVFKGQSVGIKLPLESRKNCQCPQQRVGNHSIQDILRQAEKTGYFQHK